MQLVHRQASSDDHPLLAEWNHQLIRDEGHRNPITVQELQTRLRDWLATDYRAVIFSAGNTPAAYALYREEPALLYLRQFFVCRDQRRRGIGRAAMEILFSNVWPKNKRLTVDVLTPNHAAISFWRAVGYRDYALSLEILPVPSAS